MILAPNLESCCLLLVPCSPRPSALAPQPAGAEPGASSSSQEYKSLPASLDDDDSAFDVLGWDVRPGDAIAFHMRTLHAAARSGSARRVAATLCRLRSRVLMPFIFPSSSARRSWSTRAVFSSLAGLGACFREKRIKTTRPRHCRRVFMPLPLFPFSPSPFTLKRRRRLCTAALEDEPSAGWQRNVWRERARASRLPCAVGTSARHGRRHAKWHPQP